MEWIGEFFINHWILVLIVNIIAFLFIIGFLFDTLNSDKCKKKNKKKINDKIIFDQETNFDLNDKKDNIKSKNDVIEDFNNSDNVNINTKDDILYTKKMASIAEKENQDVDDGVFEEFDRVVPKKKLIGDDIKQGLENFEDVGDIIKKKKKNINIDTNIDLPEIDLPKDDDDIWN